MVGTAFESRFRYGVRGGSLVLFDQSVMNIRLSCDGAGTVVVGPGVKLGHVMTPRVGGGDIRLQARSRQPKVTVGDHTVSNGNLVIAGGVVATTNVHANVIAGGVPVKVARAID